MLVRPITMKPARRSRATTGASPSAGVQSSSSAREPARVTCPLMSNRSLIETGMPANDEGAFAFTRRIGNFGKAFLDQLAGRSAPAVEIGGEGGKCRDVRHGLLGLVSVGVADCPMRAL